MQFIKSNNLKAKNYKCPKVMFYTGIPRSFRSDLIGYLYEISQVYPVVLLSEKLDSETEKIIRNKELFPKLEKIIEIGQYPERKLSPINLIARHRYFSKMAKDLIQYYRPDIVFATGRNIFESYLRRFAKNVNAITIAGTGPLLFSPKYIKTAHIFWSAYNRFPAFLPKNFKILCAKWRRYLAHIFYYWISPLFAGQRPFIKEPSYILWDVHNVEGADYYFVFLKEDYDILVKNNAPAKKLFILAHPLQGRKGEIFEKINFPNRKKLKIDGKILTIMWPLDDQIGFERKNFALIPMKEMQKNKIKIVGLIAQILKGWKIFIKPHPMAKDNPKQFQAMVKNLELISNQIKVTDPLEVLDEYIEVSDVIVGLPPASTSIFNASLQCPEKPILSLDLYQELGGDIYKNFDKIEYIDNEEKLIHILKLIKDNKYQKKIKSPSRPEGFLSIVDAIEWILEKNKN